MRNWLAAVLAVASMQAAVIRGVVVEHQTGKPLLRAVITLKPVPGTSGPTLSARTNAYGIFDFPPVPGGAYVITASRKNFATVQYGQKDWRSAGAPVIVDESASTFLNIRLPHLGAINGRVVDENDVGLPNHEVVAYRNTRPPQLVSRVTADERGVYRIYDLDPGSYLVRTVAKEYDEGSYLPTFSKESNRVEDARPVEVILDQEADRIDVRPSQGRLYKIGGVVHPGMSETEGPNAGFPVPVDLTFASDMGRETTKTADAFRFPSVPPGNYEVYAEGPGDGTPNCFMIGGYRPLEIRDKDALDIDMPVPCVRETLIYITEGRSNPVDSRLHVQLLTRRKDMAGVGEIKTRDFPLNRYGLRIQLAPGRWELQLIPPSGYCVTEFSFSRSRSDGLERTRPDGWNEVLVGSTYASIRYSLSHNPGSLHGLVSGVSHEPVQGAPVYLEGYDTESRSRVIELKTALTDMRGNYTFGQLAPGWYRVLSSFEYLAPDSATMENAGAKLVKVDLGQDATQDLDLSMIR